MNIGIISSQVASTPPVSCAYPLSNAPVAGFGYLAPTMSNGDQTISTALTAGTHNWGAASTTQPTNANAGKIVERLKLDTLPLVATGDGGVAAALQWFTLGFAQYVALEAISQDGAYSFLLGINSVLVASGALATLPAFIDLEFDAVATTITAKLPDGTTLGSGAYAPQQLLPLLAIAGNSLAGAAVGATATCSLVTGAADLADSPFAGTGATDACGNEIS